MPHPSSVLLCLDVGPLLLVLYLIIGSPRRGIFIIAPPLSLAPRYWLASSRFVPPIPLLVVRNKSSFIASFPLYPGLVRSVAEKLRWVHQEGTYFCLTTSPPRSVDPEETLGCLARTRQDAGAQEGPMGTEAARGNPRRSRANSLRNRWELGEPGCTWGEPGRPGSPEAPEKNRNARESGRTRGVRENAGEPKQTSGF